MIRRMSVSQGSKIGFKTVYSQSEMKWKVFHAWIRNPPSKNARDEMKETLQPRYFVTYEIL